MSTSASLPTARRRRFLRRGTAMTEFVIIAPVIGLMMASVAYFRDAHQARIGAMRQARQQAWATAYGPDNCQFTEQIQSQFGGIGGAVDNLLGGPYFAGLTDMASMFSFGRQRVITTQDATVPNWLGGTQTMTGTYYIYCNEPTPYNTDAMVWLVRGLLQIYYAAQFF